MTLNVKYDRANFSRFMHILYNVNMKSISRIIIVLIIFLVVLLGTAIFWFVKTHDVADLLDEPIVDVAQIHGFVAVENIPARVCDIRAYGATRDNEQQSTYAINAAIMDCSQRGGGVVYVPEGQWFTGGIILQSNINLFLAEGSELIFSTDLHDYLPVVLTRFQGMELYNYAPLIYAADCHDVAITGKGKLIGNGDDRAAWTGDGGNFEVARQKLLDMSVANVRVEDRVFGENISGLRPSFIQFMRCNNIVLDGITIENGPFWTVHPVYSENFIARNLTITTWSGNTDGIAIDSTKNVLIENSYFSAGDDAISIKSGLDEEGRNIGVPSENIRIQNITVTKGSSGVSIGSEMSGGVRNVVVRDSVFQNTRHGFRIKSTKSRGGFVDDVLVENVTMDQMSGDAIDINLSYSTEVQSDIVHKPIIKNISVRHINGRDNERLGINMDGIAKIDMRDIVIEDVTFDSTARGVSINNVSHVTLDNIHISGNKSPTIEIDESRDITVQNISCGEESDPCMEISGVKSDKINIKNVDEPLLGKFLLLHDGASLDTISITK